MMGQPHTGEFVAFSTLRARGWTATLIQRFLGESDREVRNPVFRSAAPMKLYAIHRVEEAEKTPAFRQAQVEAKVRSMRAQSVAEQRRKELISLVEKTPIRVKVLERLALRRKAIANYNERQAAWWCEIGQFRGAEMRAADESASESFLLRIETNYARHVLTSYDSELAALFGQVGVSAASDIIRRRVYEKIAETYPHLRDECERQQSERTVQVA